MKYLNIQIVCLQPWRSVPIQMFTQDRQANSFTTNLKKLSIPTKMTIKIPA